MFAEYSWAEVEEGCPHHPNVEEAILRKTNKYTLQNGCNIENIKMKTNNDNSDLNCSVENPSERNYNLNYTEVLATGFHVTFPVEEVLNMSYTPFQKLQFMKTHHFGLCLMMDNHMQSAEADEAVYHESLVHPALLAHPNPNVVFIGGGGEGATLREVLKHKSVKRVVMVDIDEKATRLCEKYLPQWSDGSFNDSRLELVFCDASAYLEKCNEKFDVIIMDICDPIKAGPGWKLYTKEFYEKVKTTYLNTNGIFSTQSASVSLNTITECFSVIDKTLRDVFEVVLPMRVHIQSFGTPWGIHICSNIKKNEQGNCFNLCKSTNPEIINNLLTNRMGEEIKEKLKHFDGEALMHMTHFSVFERKALTKETRVFSLKNPIYMI